MATKKKAAEVEEADAAEVETELVKMVREAADGGPTEADVHPDEVDNYKRGNWRVAE